MQKVFKEQNKQGTVFNQQGQQVNSQVNVGGLTSNAPLLVPVLLNDWKGCEPVDVWRAFQEYARWNDEVEPPVMPDNMEILLASYTYESYSGSAFVLFKQGDKLYQNYGSHCSCYGLEGQWQPEETSIVKLRNRVIQGKEGYELVYPYEKDSYRNLYGDEFLALLNTLEGGSV
jgi:hypothetical protein